MDNRDTDRVWDYHNRTKHSAESVRSGTHSLDWDNQPFLFKVYPDLDPLALPRETTQTGVAALSAIATPSAPVHYVVPTLDNLTHLLHFSAGVTKRRRYSGGEFLFRAASCTGALYEIELYVVCGQLPDLAAGVYHFNPGDMGLRRLREGDYRGLVVRASGGEPSVGSAPVVVVSTGTYWRNAWKYQARTYRHFGWDNGTLLANTLAMAAALGLPAQLVLGFVDAQINGLLGLDTHREVALSLLALGHTHATPAEPPDLISLPFATVPLSRREVDYPLMHEIHRASSLAAPEEVISWRTRQWAAAVLPSRTDITPLEPLSDERMPRDTIEEVISRRGSSRRFRREPISLAQLSMILDRSTRGIPADFAPSGVLFNDLYLIVHAVDGLKPGAYFYHRGAGLELLKPGEFRREAAYLGLEQELPGDAAVAVFFLASLDPLLERLGNRGYRAVQLEAGILGGRMYLAAYAQRLGASGLTFYDDDVVNFFSPHAAGKSAIFLMALGHGAKVRSSR